MATAPAPSEYGRDLTGIPITRGGVRPDQAVRLAAQRWLLQRDTK